MSFTRIPWVVAAIVLLSGCFDYRRSLARSTLFTEEGLAREPEFHAALQARFPAGTPIEALESFVSSNRGECRPRESGRRCDIPVFGHFCGVHLVSLDVTVSEGLIHSLSVTVGGVGC